MEILKKFLIDKNFEYDDFEDRMIDFDCFTTQTYSMSSLIFYIKNRNLDYSEYVQKCVTNNIKNISEKDIEPVLNKIEQYNIPNKYIDHIKYSGQNDYSFIFQYECKSKTPSNTKLHVIVPLSVSSLVSIGNVKNLIIDKIYKPVDIEDNLCDDDDIEFTYNERKIHVTNNPSTFTDEDWKNVICIFLDGEKWQFKNWGPVDLVQIFNSIPTFHVHYENLKSDFLQNYKVIDILVDKKNYVIVGNQNIWNIINEKIKKIIT